VVELQEWSCEIPRKVG